MRLIDKFHEMELTCGLFNLGKEESFPVWDIVRYHIYREYYYNKEDAKRFFVPKNHQKTDYLYLLAHVFRFLFVLMFKKTKILILTASRYKNADQAYYDKSAVPIINFAGKQIIVMEAILGKRVAYPYIYDFNNVFSRFYKSQPLARSYFDAIAQSLVLHLGENKITYEWLNNVIHEYVSDVAYYTCVFKKLGIKKLFIVPGNPKSTIKVAKELGIQTYLVQHAGIEFDEVDYSYAKGIDFKSPILFADYLLTFGDYWCNNINVPTKVLSVGNDFFCLKPNYQTDHSILVVSTIVHGTELSKLMKEFAKISPNIKIIFKLHPNEFHYVDDYKKHFEKCENVQVITTEKDTNDLIALSELVVLIVSAVAYEALSQNKKVAIYKRVNFERQLVLADLKNVYFIDGAKELSCIMDSPTIKSEVNFYKPTDKKLLDHLLNN